MAGHGGPSHPSRRAQRGNSALVADTGSPTGLPLADLITAACSDGAVTTEACKSAGSQSLVQGDVRYHGAFVLEHFLCIWHASMDDSTSRLAL